ncbi:hypothetical protein OX284_013610 [Flavobacterium sp. SUN046]|uniref:hypothetical protein n=1 Tax=Flavobacterium sp. SUN046 TaxID=3002440 RepID=UPI002DB56E16|nr:hypothetical protein [Flavobacterium sp. SUN046]MEC4050474.1 hypothetical protein [Flavobacterium sp. SUN046]
MDLILSTTAQKVIAAYGGKELWTNATSIKAEASVNGLAFILKLRPYFNHIQIELAIDRVYCKITPIGNNPNISGILEGDSVRLENEKGEVIAERLNPRSYFPYGRRLFYWDDLDMAYFANYAFWNYFTLPKLLLNDQIQWREIEEGHLRAHFPETIPTHSKIQDFYFDKNSGLLLQHNYTADIISKFAKAAHLITNHDNNSSLIFPSERIVTPRSKSGSPLKAPILIDIKVHKYQVMI